MPPIAIVYYKYLERYGQKGPVRAYVFSDGMP